MSQHIICTNDKCKSCNKFLKDGVKWNENAYLQTCVPPYFYANWNESKHHEKPDFCNLCYYEKEFFCCRKKNELCVHHKKLPEFQRLEILYTINNDVDNLKKLNNMNFFMANIQSKINKVNKIE